MKTIGHTQRIFLRETNPNDARAIYELNKDPQVIQFTGDPPFSSIAEAEHFLIKYDHFDKYQRGRWAICDKGSNQLIGWCGLKFHQDDGENDLGYRLFRKYWNRGYATESSHLALQYGFRRLGLDNVIARAVKKNIASIKVMLKLGFHYEKDFEEHGNACEQYRIDKYNYMLMDQNYPDIVLY